MKQVDKKISHTEREHSTVGASGSKRWLNCPGSVAAEAAAPEQADSDQGKRGTLMHEKLERIVRGWLKTGVFKYKDQEEKEEFEDLADYIVARLKEHGLSPREALLVEEKIDLSEIVDPLCFGTNDLAIVQPFGLLEVIDYKSGNELVEAKDNTQLIYYAIGIAHKQDFNFSDVRLTIYQPPNKSKPLDHWDIDINKLESYVPLFRKGVERTKKKDARRFAGDWCKWCRAADDCETLKQETMKKIGEDFDFEEPRDLVVVEKGLTPEKVSAYLDAADKLEMWITAIRARAKEMLENKKQIPGWGLIPTRSSRVWKSEAGAAKLAKNMKVKFYKESACSPAELEKKVGKKKFQERFEVFVEKKESGNLRLGRLRDVTQDFDDIPEESEW
jgi:hypothetical protein